VVWIVGGVDKGNDYNELIGLVENKVKSIIALGVDNSKIIEAFGSITEVIEADSMKNAVRKAAKLAKKGDAVLLSPCCASFDLFENFEDRGNQFKNQVRNL
jgi:UDP-N-acetylmuramoylalanine--D-glutamate ligase